MVGDRSDFDCLRLSYKGWAERSRLPSHEPVFTQALAINSGLSPKDLLMEIGNY